MGTLLGELHVPAPPGLRPVPEYVAQVLGRLDAIGTALPRRMVERARGLLADLRADGGASGDQLLHTDLHFENVLAALPGSGRPEWLAIDPHPMAGHPGFEVQPLLRNRREELGTGSGFRWSVRRRLEICCDAAGIDVDEAAAARYPAGLSGHDAWAAGVRRPDGALEAP